MAYVVQMNTAMLIKRPNFFFMWHSIEDGVHHIVLYAILYKLLLKSRVRKKCSFERYALKR